MSDDIAHVPETRALDEKRPKHVRNRLILSDAGIGMTGGILIEQAIDRLKGKTPAKMKVVGGLAALTGAGIGAFVGTKEAHGLDQYRLDVNEQIGNLNEKVRGLEAAIGHPDNKLSEPASFASVQGRIANDNGTALPAVS